MFVSVFSSLNSPYLCFVQLTYGQLSLAWAFPLYPDIAKMGSLDFFLLSVLNPNCHMIVVIVMALKALYKLVTPSCISLVQIPGLTALLGTLPHGSKTHFSLHLPHLSK